MWESCLSIPGMTGKVERYNNILVHYFDENGVKRRIGANGYHAGMELKLISTKYSPVLTGIFQHEIDHLNGMLFVDKLVTPQSLYFDEEWAEYHAHEGGLVQEGDVKFLER